MSLGATRAVIQPPDKPLNMFNTSQEHVTPPPEGYRGAGRGHGFAWVEAVPVPKKTKLGNPKQEASSLVKSRDLRCLPGLQVLLQSFS